MADRRILAIALPGFAAERVARRHPALADRPFVLAREEKGRRILAACNRAAHQAGFAPGMVVADARAILPDLPVFEATPEADARALTRLALWAGRYTPFAAPGRDNTLMLDISGCAHFYGGEEDLAGDALSRLKGFGFDGWAGIAGTLGAAWALAHHGDRDRKADVLPPGGDLREALGALSVQALRLDTETALALANFGLRRIGDLYDIARPDLAARFGDDLLLRLDQALGRVDEPLSPLSPPPEFEVQESFPEPLSNPATMVHVLDSLLERLCHILTREGRGAGHLSLTGFCPDGRVLEVTAGGSRPSRDAAVWARLFREKLPALNRGPGYDFLRLAARRTAPLAAAQADWQGSRPDMAALSPLIDRLGNRFGFRKLQRLEIVESWWPEAAMLRRPVFDTVSPRAWPAARPRPLKLLATPAPITAMAPVPDDPPLFFRWRGALYRVRAADGPERLLPEWWHGDARPRDYYQVEDEAGRRFWLYREGLYNENHIGAAGPPRWFLHGFFA